MIEFDDDKVYCTLNIEIPKKAVPYDIKDKVFKSPDMLEEVIKDFVNESFGLGYAGLSLTIRSRFTKMRNENEMSM